MVVLSSVPRWAGVTVGVIAGVVAARSGDLGTGLLIAAPLFGLCALLGVLVGELMVRPPQGPTRTAAVEVRRVRDYLPRHLGRVVAGAAVGLLVLVAATTAAGSPDDLGRPGRSIGRQCTAATFESHGPWPGSFYTGRLAIVVLAGLLLAGSSCIPSPAGRGPATPWPATTRCAPPPPARSPARPASSSPSRSPVSA